MFNELYNGISTPNIVLIIVWIAIAILAVIIETETAQLVSIWFGVGSIAGLICAVFNLPFFVQMIVFASLSLILVAITRPLVKKISRNTEIRVNADRFIDKIGQVTVDIPTYGKGEVLVLSQRWTAIALNNQSFKAGEQVVVKSIDGNKLVVDAIQEIEIK